MEDRIREAIMKMGRPEDMPALVVDICNDAWRELTKQKLMTALDRSNGPNMERRAAITVAYLNEFYESAMKGKELPRARTEEFQKQVMATFRD